MAITNESIRMGINEAPYMGQYGTFQDIHYLETEAEWNAKIETVQKNLDAELKDPCAQRGKHIVYSSGGENKRFRYMYIFVPTLGNLSIGFTDTSKW